jgi:predicted DNA-binding transcriptional regulator AlpA
MRQESDHRWTASSPDPPLEVSAATRDGCLTQIRRAVTKAGVAAGPAELTLVVETIPLLAGVAEAAGVMGWDKRRVITYINRGSFPRPLQALAGGRVWARSDVEAFATQWRARRRLRRRS